MMYRETVAIFMTVGTLLVNFAANPVVAVSATAVSATSSLVSASPKDPNLEQTVSDSETIAPEGETRVLRSGHIDLGPVFPNYDSAPTELALLARDDTEETPVWRQTNDVLFAVGKEGQQVLPEGGAYNFTGKTSGETVWALPQTQVANVPWLGWNTQSPKVAEVFDRGVTFEFLGHQGSGQFTVFLQAGGFGEPQVLWTSAKPEAQTIWVDLLTHTHANWVFTEPGIHLVKLRVKGTTKDGQELTASGVLRFGVGEYDENAAFTTTWDTSQEATVSEIDDTKNNGEASATKVDYAAQTSSIVNQVVYGSAVLAVILIGLIGFVILRGKKAQQAAKAVAENNANTGVEQ